MANTQILLGMGHDGANGRITLNEKGFGQLSWPELLKSSTAEPAEMLTIKRVPQASIRDSMSLTELFYPRLLPAIHF